MKLNKIAFIGTAVVLLLLLCGCSNVIGAEVHYSASDDKQVEINDKQLASDDKDKTNPAETDLQTEEPKHTEILNADIPVSDPSSWRPPISDAEYVNDSFRTLSSPTFTDDAERYTLTCVELDKKSYAESEQIITVGDSDKTELTVHCTWGYASREVYVGLKSCDSESFYVISATGGVISGVFDLSVLPKGDYHVVLYSNDNPSVSAVLLYQLQ